MSADLEKICDAVSPKIALIIWVTKKELEKKPWPFDGLDYLFNGLLTKTKVNLKSQGSPKSQAHFLASESFGHQLHLLHIPYQAQSFSKELINLLNLIKPEELENREALFIQDELQGEKIDLKKILRSKFPKLPVNQFS